MTQLLPSAAPALTTRQGTLIVNDQSSTCSACGRSAATCETAHRTSYPEAVTTCGISYQAVALAEHASEMSAPAARGIAAALGLPYVGRDAATRVRRPPATDNLIPKGTPR